ncbi:hypothetical protein [Flavobacterium cerinum]|uniref:Uncharacterized protein n=1 Tax=Flavobacterium cerinum TaxID=2502784 RepID=A0A444HC09_9FLAO|nr:hypothetical protein [Flavobacterium cerinum]RWX00907.1 hypothetical protein EPI11_07755 [Flavobacterium cerinum]
MNKIVKQGQSFFDKVLELTGSIENSFDMSLANDSSLTDDLAIGDEILATTVTNKAVIAIWSGLNEPATMITDNSVVAPPSGIGYMQIGTTFKVS